MLFGGDEVLLNAANSSDFTAVGVKVVVYRSFLGALAICFYWSLNEEKLFKFLLFVTLFLWLLLLLLLLLFSLTAYSLNFIHIFWTEGVWFEDGKKEKKKQKNVGKRKKGSLFYALFY